VSGNRKGPQPDEVKDYGYADCIDCGKYTRRRLMAHIPHICTDCLFPVFAPITFVTDTMRDSRAARR
jgi:hypothetical protein